MHASASKEVNCVHQELAKHVQAGYIAVFPLENVYRLQKLWLSLLTVISQQNRVPWMIYDFTWRVLNTITTRLPPQEVMRFGNILHRSLKKILNANPFLGPVYIIKVDLSDTYM